MRRLQLEILEDRRLLTGPELIGIQPNDGALLQRGAANLRNVAPVDLTFRFDENAVIDESSIGGGIRIVRSGLDAQFQAASATTNFNTGGVVQVKFSAARLGASENGISVVITKSDHGGAGGPTITVAGRTIRADLNTNANYLSTAQSLVDAINNNAGARDLVVASVSAGIPQTNIATPATPATLTLTGANDVVIQPGFIGRGDTPNEVVARFAEPLPDDQYRIDVFGAGFRPLRNTSGEAFNDGVDETFYFELDLGPQVVAIVPQPITRNPNTSALTQAGNQIQVYFNDDDLDAASATKPAFYQLFFTKDTVANTDDVLFNPTKVDYDPASDMATLTFGQALSIDQLAGAGTYRLRIGTDEAVPLAPTRPAIGADPGSSFADAYNLGVLGARNQIVSESIDCNAPTYSDAAYALDYPGAEDEPGHRDIFVQDHYDGRFDSNGNSRTGIYAARDGTNAFTVFQYNFQEIYGYDPEGNELRNLITAAQRERAREIFEIFSDLFGVDFVETDTSFGATDNNSLTIVTGDMRAISPAIGTGPGGTTNLFGRTGNLPAVAIMDSAENWDDQFGGSWFNAAMQAIGFLLGLDLADDLSPITVMANRTSLAFNNPIEPDYPGDYDIVHGQHLYRPESKDIDLYRFTIQDTGLFTAEIFAERQPNSSYLDSVLRVYQNVLDANGNQVLDANGNPVRQLIAQNDDYFSEDSFIKLDLVRGTYYVGVSASGNDSYDPTIVDSGLGGTSVGAYDLRLNFRPTVDNSIVDADNTPTRLDGDADGAAGGVYNFWFRAVPNTIFVDKISSATPANLGTLTNPYNKIGVALAAAQPGDVVRIVGNPGADKNINTLADNRAYQIGFDSRSNPLPDGVSLKVPRLVTVMIDAGAVLKLNRAAIEVGSTSLQVDRGGAALQVLGTPSLNVYFTSFKDTAIGLEVDANDRVPDPGDWGGLLYQQDNDRAQGRFVWESQGIFLDYVNHADLRYGGGIILIDGVPRIITPVHLVRARPEISHNLFTYSADAGISADPNSFEETNFHSPPYQFVTPFTSDYDRVGPDIHRNTLLNNTTNALFIRILTPAGQQVIPMTVSGRWDDTDIVHVVAEELKIQGTPGGAFIEDANNAPPADLVTLAPQTVVGATLAAGTYNYRITYVDADGNEGVPSAATRNVVLAAGQNGVLLANLPPATSSFVARRIYRSTNAGAAPYTLVAQINASDTTFLDNGKTAGGQLNVLAQLRRPRLDARLSIDPGTIVKFKALARIETTVGAQLIAEGLDGREVIFTSLLDDRFGGSGTFDTNNDDALGQSEAQPAAGDWGGIYVGHSSIASIDHALFTFAGGLSEVEGNFAGFNALEIHQGKARVAHSVFDSNGPGTGGQAPADRYGYAFNDDGVIFVRGAQPVIYNNIIRNNSDGDPSTRIAAVNINVNALNSATVADYGRSTGLIDRFEGLRNNQGPLIANNRLGNNDINGMIVRGETLTTESVWDDTSIVHVVEDTIYVVNFHTYGGLRLESSPTESLVVKLSGPNAGFTASGEPLDVDDRIGGAVQVVGQPGSPVVLTSLNDATVGAGFDPRGRPQNDTANNGLPGRTTPRGSFDIQWNMGPGLQANPAAAAAFRMAEAIWESIIEDPVTVSVDVELATMQPGVSGGAMAEFASVNYDVVRQAMMDDARPHETIVSQLPSFADLNVLLPSGGSNPFTVSQTMQLTRANAKALGLTTPTTPSVFNPSQNIDGTIAFNDLYATMFDYDRSDGIGAGLLDFVAVVVHEMGHVLGFISAGDDVDWALAAGPPPAGPARNIELTPLDLFRVEPGANRTTDFTHTPRVLDPALTAVLYDGGHFDPTGVPIAGLQRGDVPMSTGQFYGDGYQASHFKDDMLTAGIFLGMMDPVPAPAGMRQDLTIVDERAFDVIGWDVAGAGIPGDWQSVLLDEFSHDRNVAVVLEQESADTDPPGANGTPALAQDLGMLAPSEKSGDDNLRLGFDIHGFINAPSDVDVYSFKGTAGTEVWFDIDRTTNALDSVVELIDANGVLIAQSDNSVDEGNQTLAIYEADPVTQANPLQKTAYQRDRAAGEIGTNDEYTTNPRDAGMRIVLPGVVGTQTTYYVRVRSSNLKSGDPRANLQDPNRLLGGLTSGVYQLQIRLREVDEVPGSAVQFADIRYATNGIEVRGLPAHSPLLGEATEITSVGNDALAAAQMLGNLLNTDRAALSVAGNISSPTDVDCYQFEVNYDDVTNGGINSSALDLATIFDVDYADGFARGDLRIDVYNSAGVLVLTADNSNIAEDQPAPLHGADVDDLSRATNGVFDPYIGSTELPVGTYTVVVTPVSRAPQELNQFSKAACTNPLVRLEPNDAIQRIAEDHITPVRQSTYDAPQVSRLLDNAIVPSQNANIVPYQLGDVVLFVSQNSAQYNPNDTTIRTVNPFTGQQVTTLGEFDGVIGDIAMRPASATSATPHGALFTFTHYYNPANSLTWNDAVAGNFLQINTGTAAATTITDDGILTWINRGGNAVAAGPRSQGAGVWFNAMAFSGADQRTLFAVGDRGDHPNAAGVQYTNNILYSFYSDTGIPDSWTSPSNDRPIPGSTEPAYSGAGTTPYRERGQLVTTLLQGNAPEATEAPSATDDPAHQNPQADPVTTHHVINDTNSFTLQSTNWNVPRTFEIDTGPEASIQIGNVANPSFDITKDIVRDGNIIELDGDYYQFDTGSAPVVQDQLQILDGDVFTIVPASAPTMTIRFEFDNNNNVTLPNVRVSMAGNVVANIVSAINSVGYGLQATAIKNLISLQGDRTVGKGASLNGVRIEGEFGLAPIVTPIPWQISDTNTFTVSVFGGPAVTFEFDTNNNWTLPNVQIPLSITDGAATVAAKMATAINANTQAVATIVGALVVINGPQVAFTSATPGLATATAGGTVLSLQDYSDTANIDGLIQVEETDNLTTFSQKLMTAMKVRRTISSYNNAGGSGGVPQVVCATPPALRVGQAVVIQGLSTPNFVAMGNGVFDVGAVAGNNFDLAGVTDPYAGTTVTGAYFIDDWASADGERVNFLGANTGNFSGTPILKQIAASSGGVSPTNIRLGILAADTAVDIATKLEQRITQRAQVDTNLAGITVSRSGSTITVNSATASNPSPCFATTFTSFGQGGQITGLTFVGGTMYAVDDRGGLYRVNNYTSQNASATFIANVGGLTVNFEGLTTGPADVEGGKYASTLFAIAGDGYLYAFNTSGVLQNVFADGSSRAPTGITNATGLAFSTLDENLWHITDRRSGDAGHGVVVPFDDSRRADANAGYSFYFGFEDRTYNRYDYDFPGGAQGSIETDPFSLAGVTPADQPMLYFNYYLDTENANYAPGSPPTLMRDSFRVYATDSSGEWQLLATNDSFRSTAYRDEYDLGDVSDVSVEDTLGRTRGIQELFDNTGTWRQARIPLAALAGQEFVKLRFDFSTAGSMNTGDTRTTGDELLAIPGADLRDGQTFVLDGNTTFEFDLGYTLVAPSGAMITDGEWFRITAGGNWTDYEFDNNNNVTAGRRRIAFSSIDTPAQLAQKIVAAINGPPVGPAGVAPILSTDGRNNNRVNLTGATGVANFGGALQVEGMLGVTVGRTQVIVNAGMTRDQVATAIRTALANRYNGGDIKGYREVVRIINHDVTNRGPLGLEDNVSGEKLFGDEFGAFNASGPPQSTRYPGSLRGMDNLHEGVFIDDLIIGFAEHGEMVTGATADDVYIANAWMPDYSIDVGDYQLEIRPGAQYAESIPTTPSLALFRSFNTNDRLAQQVSFVAPAAHQLYDGQTFVLSDGVDTLTFEFDDVNLKNLPGEGVAAGRVRVPFNPLLSSTAAGKTSQSAAEVAAAIRDAINSAASQAVLSVTAGLADGIARNGQLPGFTSTSKVVNLYGPATGNLDATQDHVSPTLNFGNIPVTTYGIDPKLTPISLAYLPNLEVGNNYEYGYGGDQNRFRDQGQILIQSTKVTDALEYGIQVGPGDRLRTDLVPPPTQIGDLPHAGPVRITQEKNNERLTPGVTITNNLIVRGGQGGIYFGGDPNPGGQQLASTPFGRIVNNTIYGGGTGIGIQVANNASPTLMNNIVANLNTGIRVDNSSSSTVVVGSLFQNNTRNTVGTGLGTFPIVLASGAPLFIDVAHDNFYLAEGALAVDSARDSVQDRDAFRQVKAPLGISRSPILAPDRDLTGQKRASTTIAGSQGGIDRGALDRIDFAGPTAVLIVPRDNDAEGADLSPANTVVKLSGGTVLSRFEIRLFDGLPPAEPSDGAGIADSSVITERLTVTRDGVRLVDGVDYSFSYDTTSDTIRLMPLAGIWEPDRIYVINLRNSSDAVLVTAPNGGAVADGNSFTITDTAGHAATFEFDSGFVLQVPQTLTIHVPAAAAGPGGIADGQWFSVTRTGSPPVTFEFDSAPLPGSVTPGRVRVEFAADYTVDQIANAIVQALTARNLGLSARNLGGGLVHLGSTASHSLNTSSSALTQSGQPGGVSDGQTFQISDGTKTVTFEFDSDNVWNAGNTPIAALLSETHLEIAPKIIQAVANAGLGLNPISLEDGFIHLGGSASHQVDTSLSSLNKLGSPGVSAGAVPVPSYVGAPSLDATQVAAAMVKAIRQAVNDGRLTEVKAIPEGGATILIDGVASVVDNNAIFVSNMVVGAIRDLAGNDLKPNQANGETKFTIQLGAVSMDFGDAADPTYPTLLGSNGAGHMISSLKLGALIDSEADGQPTAAADGDGADEDGVSVPITLNSYLPTAIDVVASQPGLLDAWIDFNRDGDWNDFGEQIFFSEPLAAGLNHFTVTTPLGAVIGHSTARFRISSTGGLLPTGLAADGEVEDYGVEILPGTPPVANDDPDPNPAVANPADYQTTEDRVIIVNPSVTLLANDTDVDNDPLVVSPAGARTSTLGALVSVNADGTFSYDPTAAAALQAMGPGQQKLDTFTYTVNDNPNDPAHGFTSNAATVTITVLGVNDAPTADSRTLTALEDVMLPITLTGDDGDADVNQALTFILTNLPATGKISETAGGAPITQLPGGGLTLADPQIFFTTALNDTTQQLFRFQVRDNGGTANGGADTSAVATVTVNITSVNDRPTAYNQTATVLEDVETAITLTADDGDPEVVQTLTYILTALPTAGKLSQSAGGAPITQAQLPLNLADPELFFTTALNDTTQRAFQFRVRDNGGTANGGADTSAVATVTVDVTPVNDRPIANAQTLTTLEDVELPITLAGQDGDPEVDQKLTFVITSLPAAGRLSQTPGGPALTAADLGSPLDDPQVFFLTAPNDVAQRSFDFRVLDDGGIANGGIDVSADARITINVTPVNDAPIANAQNVTATEDVERMITLTRDDGDPEVVQNLTFILTSLPATAKLSQTSGGPAIAAAQLPLTLNGPNLFFLTAKDDTNQQTFQFRARDNGGTANGGVDTSAVAQVTVDITPVNDAPTAVNDVYQALPGAALNVNAANGVLKNDVDPDTAKASLTAARVAGSGPANGVLTFGPDGSFTYTPNPGFSGNDSFRYRSNDGQADSNEATVDIRINAPPTARDDPNQQTQANTPVTITVLANDTDSDGVLAPSTVAIVQGSGPAHGGAVPNANGTVAYTPAAGYVGQDQFRYTVQDDDGAVSNEATVTINIGLNPYVFRNSANNLDVNLDGAVTAADALAVINALNANGGPFTVPSVKYPAPPKYYNTTGAEIPEQVTALDALAVINYLNAQSLGSPEGEGSVRSAAASTASQPPVSSRSFSLIVAPALTDAGGAALPKATQPQSSARSVAASSGGAVRSVDLLFASGDAAWLTSQKPAAALPSDVLLLDAVARSGLEGVLADISEDVVGAFEGSPGPNYEDALFGGLFDSGGAS